jgi:hypothetical protein
LQAPAFHFIAIQCNRNGSVHSSRGFLARAISIYTKTFSM